jgi:hypothetical protein
MAMTTNDVVVQNMFLLIDNILSHKTCMKPRDRILNKGAENIFSFSTHGAPTLVDFYTYVELNKDTIVECPHELMAYKIIKVE